MFDVITPQESYPENVKIKFCDNLDPENVKINSATNLSARWKCRKLDKETFMLILRPKSFCYNLN